MKTVMVLSANFPPRGGAGVFRTLKFTKYLPTVGWRPIVVTPQAGIKHIQDDSLAQEVPEDTIIHRPTFFDYQRRLPKIMGKIFRSIEKRLYFPDNYARWNKTAYQYISQNIIPQEKIDLIYTTMSPYSSMLLAHSLKQHYQIPFVLDFEDPFSFNQYVLLDQKNSYRKKAQQIEKIVFRDADHINNVTQIWKAKYETLYPEISPKSSLIHNGYDEEDFVDLGRRDKNKLFTIGYNGTFSRIVPLEPLISAIIDIHQNHKIPMRLNIATPLKKAKLESRYAYLFQNDLIEYKGFLPHQESLKNVLQSDISALILNDLEATEGMIPAKTFEYLRIGNPILVLHRKNSFLANIIEKTKTGITVDISDHDQIVQSLLSLHEQWRSNFHSHQPDWDKIERYEYRHLSQKLAEVFEKII